MKRFWAGAMVAVLVGAAGWMALPGSGKAEAADAEKKPAEKQARQQLLETVGALAATHFYQAFLNIGFIADGRAGGRYGDKDANKVLESVLSLLRTVDKQLEAVGKLDLDPEDRSSLERMRKLSGLLRQQGQELQAYWQTGDEQRAAKYEEVRTSAWTSISKLLGLGK